MTEKVRVVQAIADTAGLVLYLADGGIRRLSVDDWRTGEILQKVKSELLKKDIVDLDLDVYNVHEQVEQKSGGRIRFFRKVVDWFTGNKDKIEDPVQLDAVQDQEMFAVVDRKVIPIADKLDLQIQNAAHGDGIVGFEAFMKRLATVIDRRSHTVPELLEFMRRGDLPIADDGSIIAYKVLNKRDDRFVDCHTGRVKQRLGSFVCMDEKLVDPERRHECSTGLHIARRGYLKGFSGNVCTLVKVAPEDVITVPPHEPDKMRVRAYHIVGVLSPEAHALLRSNKPMTTDEIASRLLADVIAGKHVPVTEIVTIGGPMGHDVTIKSIDGKQVETPEDTAVSTPTSKTGARAIDEMPKVKIDPGAINKEIDAVKRAAASGDLSAAISAAPAKKRTTVLSKPKDAPVDPVASQASGSKSALPEAHRQALEAVKNGMSQREAERVYHVSAKTIRKLLKGLE